MAALSVIVFLPKQKEPKGEQTMTAKSKLAQKRLTLLQIAEKLGNVSKACRMSTAVI